MTSTSLSTPPVSDVDRHPSRWALWGAAAGVCGVLTNFVFSASISQATRESGNVSAMLDEVDRLSYHLAVVSGIAAVALLICFAAAFARWARAQPSTSLALGVAPLGLVASAATLIGAYGVKGQLASYLPGGFNDVGYSEESLAVYYLLDDLAGYFGWWGVTVFFGAVVVLAFRERLIARWVGGIAVLAVVVPVIFLVAFGFPGFAGLIGPVLLVVVATGIAFQRA
jgi:hypothetical protein